jgi:uncharacterized protein YcbK (DUF882 family)
LGAPPVAVAPLPRDARISGPPSETRILATLFQTHTQDATFLSDTWPDDAAVSELLIDHVLAETHPIAPELFGMIRTLALEFPGSRFEIVSGFRSEKRNEAMRKKGHHVASHSQHSLGTAVDFRLIPACGSTTAACPPIDPIVLEKRLRKLGWKGGIGVYLPATERFVHMDVGKNRRWKG